VSVLRRSRKQGEGESLRDHKTNRASILNPVPTIGEESNEEMQCHPTRAKKENEVTHQKLGAGQGGTESAPEQKRFTLAASRNRNG